jgi:hypothetical protein
MRAWITKLLCLLKAGVCVATTQVSPESPHGKQSVRDDQGAGPGFCAASAAKRSATDSGRQFEAVFVSIMKNHAARAESVVIHSVEIGAAEKRSV